MTWKMGMLIAWDDEGEIVATLDHAVQYDTTGRPVGLVDFSVLEDEGRLIDVWNIEGAKASGLWPQWVEARTYRVETGPDGIRALKHKPSGTVIAKDEVLERIEERLEGGGEVDLRDLVGGPGVPLAVNSKGQAYRRQTIVPADLPLLDREG